MTGEVSTQMRAVMGATGAFGRLAMAPALTEGPSRLIAIGEASR